MYIVADVCRKDVEFGCNEADVANVRYSSINTSHMNDMVAKAYKMTRNMRAQMRNT